MNASVGFALGAAALFGLSTPIAKLLLGSVSPVLLGSPTAHREAETAKAHRG